MMANRARQTCVPLMTGQTLRFDSTIQALLQRRHLLGRFQHLRLTSHIETRVTGPHHAEGYGRRGALLEIGIHMLDLVRFATGDEVREVRCRMNSLPPASPEVIALAQLETYGGTSCTVDIARVPEGRVGEAELIGSQGKLQADWINRLILWHHGGEIEELKTPPSQTVLAVLNAFILAVETQSPMPVTGEDGYRAVEIAEACYRSAQAGGAPVVLGELP